MSATSSDIRVRFAPSPTGPLHIGGVRTALFNYLFAKKHGGRFLLRIEDTDQTRYVPGAEQYILDSCKWLGFDFDEGPHVGGPQGTNKERTRIDSNLAQPTFRRAFHSLEPFFLFLPFSKIFIKKEEEEAAERSHN